MGNYQAAFPWVAHHNEHFLVHDDGAVSMLVLWDGIDMGLLRMNKQKPGPIKYQSIVLL